MTFDWHLGSLVARVVVRPIVGFIAALGLVGMACSSGDGGGNAVELEPVAFSQGTFRLSEVGLAEISREGDDICISVLLDEFSETGGGCWSAQERGRHTVSRSLLGRMLATDVELGSGVAGRWLDVAYSIDESVELVRLGFEHTDGRRYGQDVEVSEGVFAFVVPSGSELRRVSFVGPTRTLECKTDGFVAAAIVTWQC